MMSRAKKSLSTTMKLGSDTPPLFLVRQKSARSQVLKFCYLAHLVSSRSFIHSSQSGATLL